VLESVHWLVYDVRPIYEVTAMVAVSVIVPAYNAAYLAETLDSVFGQTFTDYEVIVVNDGSPETARLEEALVPYCDRIVYIKQANQGPAGARNTGIRHSRADLLAFLDSDDLWLPTFLTEQIAFFNADPSLDLAYARSFKFCGSVARKYPSRSLQSDQINFETIVTQKCQVLISCTVVRKQAVIDAGLFDTRWRGVEDFDLWVRMAHRGCKMHRNDNLLGLYRVHETSVSHNQVKMNTLLSEQLRTLPSRLELSETQKTLLLEAEDFVQCERAWLLGKEYLYAGNSAEALTSFRQAYKHFNSRKLQLTLLALQVFPPLAVMGAKLHQRLWTDGPVKWKRLTERLQGHEGHRSSSASA